MPEPTRTLLQMASELADQLESVSRKIGLASAGFTASSRPWSPDGLREYVNKWTNKLDAEDALIEQLTQCIAGFFTQSTQYERVARERATPLAYLIYANFDVKPKGVKA
ncbi:hypothetical protein PROPHIGD39-2_6 [Mycobacterium phage prophiGD39-2]|nr:hypothetical protein PROPHIGD57-1_6 [Mycobacterium phage prophiGD25-1]QST89123.1 hypothetical protein PROPHIGD39-2_6 [Mycobacterium phage prophiGD39-2]QST89667.1 hypothetical protein PROPHIGD57-1_6 [Mycobacterium phage prophi57-1]